MEASSCAHRSSTMHPTSSPAQPPSPATSAGAVLRERSGRRAGHAEQAGRAPGRPRAPCRLPLGVVCIARSAAQRAAAPAGAQFWVSCGARRWPLPQLCPVLAVSICTLPPPCPLFLAVTLSVACGLSFAACHAETMLFARQEAGWMGRARFGRADLAAGGGWQVGRRQQAVGGHHDERMSNHGK